MHTHLRYAAVRGFFSQADPAIDPTTIDQTDAFGLIDDADDSGTNDDVAANATVAGRWTRFAQRIAALNASAPPGVCYRVLFAGRHGEGHHNVAEARYGTALWDCYWALQDGDSAGTVWHDSRLTSTGVAQAQAAGAVWRAQIAEMKLEDKGADTKGDRETTDKQTTSLLPLPQLYIVSPLTRCCQTALHTFADPEEPLPLPHGHEFRPLIKELIRETIGLHTCDRRSSRSVIASSFPTFTFEPGFAEEDPLWIATSAESPSAREERILRLLDQLFDHQFQAPPTTTTTTAAPQSSPHPPPPSPENAPVYISLTSHSGTISSLLAATGHRPFPLPPGGVMPLVLRIERVDGERPARRVEPPIPAPKCPDGWCPDGVMTGEDGSVGKNGRM